MMERLSRLVGLVLLLLSEVASTALVQLESAQRATLPTGVDTALKVVPLALVGAGCVLAGFFLRSLWAVLIVPVVYWGGSFLLGGTPITWGPGYFSLAAAAVVLLSIPVAALAWLGEALGKRYAHKPTAVPAT